MGAKNLAVVFAPSVLREPSLDPMAEMHNMKHTILVIQTMIERSDDVFGSVSQGGASEEREVAVRGEGGGGQEGEVTADAVTPLGEAANETKRGEAIDAGSSRGCDGSILIDAGAEAKANAEADEDGSKDAEIRKLGREGAGKEKGKDEGAQETNDSPRTAARKRRRAKAKKAKAEEQEKENPTDPANTAAKSKLETSRLGSDAADAADSPSTAANSGLPQSKAKPPPLRSLRKKLSAITGISGGLSAKVRPPAFILDGSHDGHFAEALGAYVAVPNKPHYEHVDRAIYCYPFLLPGGTGTRIWVVGHTLDDPNGYWIGNSSRQGGVTGPPTAVETWVTHEKGGSEWIPQPGVRARPPGIAS